MHGEEQTKEDRSGDYARNGGSGKGVRDFAVEDSEGRIERGAFCNLAIDAIFCDDFSLGSVEE